MPPPRNASEDRLRGGFARPPGVAQAAGPIRPGRLELPVLQPVAGEVRTPLSVFGAGNGFGGSPSACTRRQNGVNTRRPRFSLLRIWPGASQQVAGEAVRGDARLSQCGGDLIFHGPVWRLRDLVPVDRLGADFARERGR